MVSWLVGLREDRLTDGLAGCLLGPGLVWPLSRPITVHQPTHPPTGRPPLPGRGEAHHAGEPRQDGAGREEGAGAADAARHGHRAGAAGEGRWCFVCECRWIDSKCVRPRHARHPPPPLHFPLPLHPHSRTHPKTPQTHKQNRWPRRTPSTSSAYATTRAPPRSSSSRSPPRSSSASTCSCGTSRTLVRACVHGVVNVYVCVRSERSERMGQRHRSLIT